MVPNPVGYDPYGFTCVSATSSFESDDEIYCGSGDNPEKRKCSGKNQRYYVDYSHTGDWRSTNDHIANAKEGARAVFNDYLKNDQTFWKHEFHSKISCYSVCGDKNQ
jgi:hypothetical protein